MLAACAGGASERAQDTPKNIHIVGMEDGVNVNNSWSRYLVTGAGPGVRSV